jgi:hypothetical protein
MSRFAFARVIIYISLACMALNAPSAAQIKVIGGTTHTTPISTMTIGDVIRLSKAKLSDDIIIQQIRKQGRPFNLSTDQLISLKNNAVSDRVIQAMIDPSTPEVHAATRNTAPPPSQPVAPPPSQPVAASQSAQQSSSDSLPPTEIGVYAKKQGQWVELLPEIVNFKTGGVLKKVGTAGIVKGDINGHLNGRSSNNTFAIPIEFLIVVPEGVSITEYQLLCLRQSGDNREFRTVTGGVFHVSGGATRDVLPFEWKKISSRSYKVSFSSISEGKQEYGFLPPGAFASANAASNGKIYSFRVAD